MQGLWEGGLFQQHMQTHGRERTRSGHLMGFSSAERLSQEPGMAGEGCSPFALRRNLDFTLRAGGSHSSVQMEE